MGTKEMERDVQASLQGHGEVLIRENEKIRTELMMYRLFSIIMGLLWVAGFVLLITR